MSIFNLSFINHSLLVLKENVSLRASAGSLLQKRIVLIAAAIFALLAVYLFVNYCFFSRKETMDEVDDVEDTTIASPKKQKESEKAKEGAVFKKVVLGTPSTVKARSEIVDQESTQVERKSTPILTPKSKQQENESMSEDSPKSSFSSGIDDLFDDPFQDEISGLWDDFAEEDDTTDDLRSPDLSKPKQVFEIDGKLFSLRTIKCQEKLKQRLEEEGKELRKSVDNGDCFWDSFAQSLTQILGRLVTIEELRQKVSEEVKRIAQGPEEENWIKKGMKGDFLDTYQEYCDRVAFTHSQVIEKKLPSPIWGRENRDGLILCHLYKVNLKVYSVGCIDENPDKMEDEENFYTDERDFPKGLPYSQTVEMALYPGHFMPVFDKPQVSP